ncbi:MAG: DNA polymerase III subunit gamma/tau [Schleiferiaceae bacterium]|nr:DNA polymerase III subunit gamma/tau [Schleiferiaceae bacterium]
MDKPYVVSARKYRPSSFDTVVGQSHVTDTLEHEVSTGNLAQALLFCGPKGVGKTSCARILAKMINELDSGAKENYELNIFELDAASNNKVDDIRQLIDQVRFAPQIGRFKVYIIDEVHMLSTAAFNAFLKTLEEPPAHAIFILATTEKHKVLPTILSRCQVFDFKRIGIQDIVSHLEFVASKEGVVAESEALHLIAEKADGALRDSLSVFDRINAFSQGEKITYQLVRENLQILDRDIFFQTLNDLKNADATAIFLQVNSVLELGFDLNLFVSGLASHVRDVLMAKHSETIDILELPNSIKQRYRHESGEMDLKFLGRTLRLLSKCDIQFRDSSSPRLLVEVTLLEIAGLTDSESVGEKKKNKVSKLDKIKNEEITKSTIKEKKVEKADIEIKETSIDSHEVEISLVNENVVKTDVSLDKKEPAFKEEEDLTKKKSAFSLRPREIKSLTEIQKNISFLDQDVKNLSPFDQENLVESWGIVAESMVNRSVVYALLNQINPILEEDFNIRVSVVNRVQSGYLEEVRDELISSLRKELKNDSLGINIHVEDSASNAKIVYTAEERYNFLLKKNPQLDEFRKEFQLDID